MKRKVIKGWVARDDDDITASQFFDTKPLMDDWFWQTKDGHLGDFYAEIPIPTEMVKRGERKKCHITIEILDA
jgi:hypothetical protein